MKRSFPPATDKKRKPPKFKMPKLHKEDSRGNNYLLVVNPWGSGPDADIGSNGFLDNVGAWFELILRDEYPGTRVAFIYYQSTHNHIIVEIPEHVDTSFMLGAHCAKNFLKHPYNTGGLVAYVYEYDYKKFGDPTTKQWVSKNPPYISESRPIPAAFPVKYPYPPPGKAPQSLSRWAKPLPLHLQLLSGEQVTGVPSPPPPSAPPSAPPLTELPLPAAPDLPGESATDAPPPPTPRSALPSTGHPVPAAPGLTPSMPSTRQGSPTYSPAPPSPPPASRSLFEPYAPPAHLYPRPGDQRPSDHVQDGNTEESASSSATTFTPKRDPYEEEEDAKHLLRSLPIKKEEPNDSPIGTIAAVDIGHGDDVSRFLDSCLPPSFKQEDTHQASEDLVSLFLEMAPRDRNEGVPTQIAPYIKTEATEPRLDRFHAPSSYGMSPLGDSRHSVKHEETRDGYQASLELQKLVSVVQGQGVGRNFHPTEARVKTEPTDADRALFSSYRPQQRDKHFSGSVAVKREYSQPRQMQSNAASRDAYGKDRYTPPQQPRIDPRARADRYPSHGVAMKTEPTSSNGMHASRYPPPTRDPRRRDQTVTAKHTRESEEGDRGFMKRVKTENRF